jgi:hypothetical protein
VFAEHYPKHVWIIVKKNSTQIRKSNQDRQDGQSLLRLDEKDKKLVKTSEAEKWIQECQGQEYFIEVQWMMERLLNLVLVILAYVEKLNMCKQNAFQN